MSADEERLDFGDGLVARVRRGPGEPVLWIHGYTIDSSSWADLWGLLPGFCHIGVDLPGHGASRDLRRDEDLPALGRTLGLLAQQWQARHMVALSLGTVIALQVAIEFPCWFSSLVLGATSLAGGPQDPEVERRYEAMAALYQEQGTGPHLRDLWMNSPPDLFKGAEGQPDLWRRLSALVGAHRFTELADFAMRRLTSPPQREADLRRIEARTLVFLGEEEMGAFRRCGEIIRRSVPRCERRYLPGVGHLCLLEAPQQVAAPIAAHLAGERAATPSSSSPAR